MNQSFKSIWFWWYKHKKNRSNDNLEPIRDVFKICNQYLQVYAWQVVALKKRCTFGVYIISKTRKNKIKISFCNI